jgi:hypothetical protein
MIERPRPGGIYDGQVLTLYNIQKCLPLRLDPLLVSLTNSLGNLGQTPDTKHLPVKTCMSGLLRYKPNKRSTYNG